MALEELSLFLPILWNSEMVKRTDGGHRSTNMDVFCAVAFFTHRLFITPCPMCFFFASSSCSCCSREKSNKAPFKTTSRHPIDFHILAETQLCGTNKTQFTHRTRQIERKSKQIDRERATQIIDSAMSLVV